MKSFKEKAFKKAKRKKEFYECPKRMCYWLNHCAVCDQDIKAGQEYYDGGYNRRCHIACAPPKKENSSTPQEKDRK